MEPLHILSLQTHKDLSNLYNYRNYKTILSTVYKNKLGTHRVETITNTNEYLTCLPEGIFDSLLFSTMFRIVDFVSKEISYSYIFIFKPAPRFLNKRDSDTPF